WLSRYRDQSFFEDTVRSVITAASDPIGSAAGQPRAAAEFLDGASEEMRASLLPRVAAAWAREAPAAAGEWVTQVELAPDAEQRRRRASECRFDVVAARCR